MRLQEVVLGAGRCDAVSPATLNPRVNLRTIKDFCLSFSP